MSLLDPKVSFSLSVTRTDGSTEQIEGTADLTPEFAHALRTAPNVAAQQQLLLDALGVVEHPSA